MIFTVAVLTAVVVARLLILVVFTIIAGVIQGRSTGRYPTLSQWTSALSKLQSPTTRSGRERRDIMPRRQPPHAGRGGAPGRSRSVVQRERERRDSSHAP